VNQLGRLTSTAKDNKKPKAVRITCALAVAYIIFPFDFLPDFMPIVGWIDDALVLISLIAYLANIRKSSITR
jgi:uncharacterized membrane protein YkvA (DUF1232 family)